MLILVFGAALVAVAFGRTIVHIGAGARPESSLSIFVLIAGAGVALLYGGYRLPDTDVYPEFYARIVGWCLGAFGLMLGLLAFYQLLVQGGIDRPDRAIPLLAALSLTVGFWMGTYDARARTRRREIEVQNRELTQTQRQLEAAIEAGEVGTWEWDVLADRVVTGASFAHAFGVDSGEVHGELPLDRLLSSIHEDDRERVRSAIETAIETCGEYEAEYRVWNAEDELRWVAARGHVECDEDGRPVTFPGALTDITQRKRAELRLQRNKDQLETLFEVIPVGVIVAARDGRLIDANDTAKEIWGGDVFDADSTEEYQKFQAVWADSGEPVEPEEWTMSRVLEGEETTDPDLFEIETADGERRVIRSAGMPIRDDTGEVVRGVVAISDVTERQEASRSLAESERRYRTLVDNFPGTVALFDEDLRYTTVGGQLFEEMSEHLTDPIGVAVQERYPDHIVEVLEPNYRAVFDGETNVVEVEYPGYDLSVHTHPVENVDGEIIAGMLMLLDVSERKEYQRRIEESNERLEQFAHAVSHDLQEPLRMVTSYLQLVEGRYGDELDEDGEEFIEFAVDGAQRMREMIDGLLEYSRVETRGDPFERIDLNAVVEDVVADLEVKIDRHDAAIDREDLPDVRGDASQLRQVFMNLFDNAIKYSGEDRPRVDVSAERRGERCVVSVRDEGIGIDPAHVDRIFDVFQRPNTHDRNDGTGIGLALCERIVERHGGEIWVDSAPGEGSTFSFTLPVTEA